MKNKLFKILLMMVLMLPMCCLFTACGEKEPENNDPPAGGGASGSSAPIATIGNFEVDSIKIFHLEGDWFNLEVGLTNKGAETASFDFSKFVLKHDKIEITHDGSMKEYDAGQYFKWSFQIDTGQGLAANQEIDVYYEEEKITTVQIKEF